MYIKFSCLAYIYNIKILQQKIYQTNYFVFLPAASSVFFRASSFFCISSLFLLVSIYRESDWLSFLACWSSYSATVNFFSNFLIWNERVHI
jgi:hypothetical protein